MPIITGDRGAALGTQETDLGMQTGVGRDRRASWLGGGLESGAHGWHVIPVEEMINKLKVANDARSSSDFLIVARTDARTSLGIDEAIRCGEAYAKADIIFIESPESFIPKTPIRFCTQFSLAGGLE